MSWITSDQVTEPGYYWARLTEEDPEPTVVRIAEYHNGLRVQEFDWEGSMELDGYDEDWQFSRVEDPL